MSDAGFASLSPSLLARKGGAKPAMRPQNAGGPIDGKQAAANLEDLGWNDMGDPVDDEDSVTGSARVVMLNPPNASDRIGSASPVRDSIERIAQKLESNANPQGRPSARAARDNRRAAFTLRLDHERHLKLRLACTVRGRSAQQLVTDALDALLGQMPEIDTIAAQVLRD